jgi:hypothetical protein
MIEEGRISKEKIMKENKYYRADSFRGILRIII